MLKVRQCGICIFYFDFLFNTNIERMMHIDFYYFFMNESNHSWNYDHTHGF